MNTVERVAKAIRNNPEGLLLLGAGVALMLRNATTSDDTTTRPKRSTVPSSDRDDSGGAGIGSAAARAGEGLVSAGKGLADKVGAAAEDIGSYVSETAQDLSHKASEYGQAATRRTRQAAESAYESAEGVFQAHPMSVAIAGISAGCLAAAIFPATRFERETLGPLGRRAADVASETGELVKTAAVERVTGAAFKASERLKDAAYEGKLKSGNPGEIARDVATAFAANVTGKTQSGQSGARQPDTRKAQQ